MTIKISEVFEALLTAKQSQVCAFLVQGYSYKEIARELSMSCRTVEDHVQHILCRTQSQDSRRLIYRALGAPEVVA
jgi:DNA-binding NarL/FixJ family response regulator